MNIPDRLPKVDKIASKEDFVSTFPDPNEVKQEKGKEELFQKAVILSEESAYIQEVMKGQPKTLEEIEVRDRKEIDGTHRLSLPPEVEKYAKKYTFRWLNSKKRSISVATQIKGWVLVNRTYFPDLPGHLFTSNGIIERGDNILAFIPSKVAKQMREAAQKQSRDWVKSRIGAHSNNPNFYAPRDNSEEGEESRVVAL